MKNIRFAMRFPSLLAVPLDFVPVTVIEHTAGFLFRHLLHKHPDLFERLGEHKARRFAFVPIDLPLVFVIEPARPALSVLRKPHAVQADASVEAPFFLLLALLEGRCDADALFFSRDLAVTGDMEAMLAMRNALDDCSIDLPSDLSRLGGPFAPVLSRVANEIRRRALEGEAA